MGAEASFCPAVVVAIGAGCFVSHVRWFYIASICRAGYITRTLLCLHKKSNAADSTTNCVKEQLSWSPNLKCSQ